MAEQADAEDRTEAATPRRLQRAREAGQLPQSQEVPSLAGLVAAALVLGMAAPAGALALVHRLAALMGQLHAIDLSDHGAAVLRMAATAWLHAAAPFVLAALLAGVLGSLLQTGFLISPGALHVDISRIDPRAGLRRLFGLASLVDALKSTAKLAVIGFAVWRAIASDLPMLHQALLWDARALLAHAVTLITHVLIATLVAQAAIATLDLFWVRFRHAQQMRMSRQDVRDETKETDGDPRIKARIRQIRMLRARKRMLAAVPKATVVITNPTHYAVALAYDRARNAAPRVVAKGVDSMAERIREVALANRVPLISNPPLARALHRVELDTDIPAEHYRAIAEIIAYVWRLSTTAQGRPRAA